MTNKESIDKNICHEIFFFKEVVLEKNNVLTFLLNVFDFLQMENIELFLKGANAYGVPDNSLFQTVDLYEGRNMAMVIATILQVGTEVSAQI